MHTVTVYKTQLSFKSPPIDFQIVLKWHYPNFKRLLANLLCLLDVHNAIRETFHVCPFCFHSQKGGLNSGSTADAFKTCQGVWWLVPFALLQYMFKVEENRGQNFKSRTRF